MKYYDLDCVFIELFGIPCPGCGMTRALLSVLRFDFIQAIKYNVIIFFMPYLMIYVWFDLKHKIHKVFLGIIGIATIFNWIIKIIYYIGGQNYVL